MELKLKFIAPPFSINAYYYKTRQRTRGARLWANDIFRQMDMFYDDIVEFRDQFDVGIHGLEIDLKFYYPEELFFNKAGTISAKTMDLSNVEKPLIDLLTQSKYADRAIPEGAENLRIDDRYIIALRSSKHPQIATLPHSIEVVFKIVPIPPKNTQKTA